MEINKILTKVARRYGTTPERVYSEIQRAIEEAFSGDDPEACKRWAMIPRKGAHPTPEDVIRYYVSKLTTS